MIANFLSKIMQRYLPDSFLLAILLTVVIFLAGIIEAGHGPLEMAVFWGQGFSKLFTFGMQMVLVLLMGYVLALTPAVHGILDKLTNLAKTPRQALLLTATISFAACYLNWGFGLVVGAMVAKEMGRKVAGLHFPLVVAAAYSAELIRGPSSAIPLVVATPQHFLHEQIGLIPVSETLYSSWNLMLSAGVLVLLLLMYAFVSPPENPVSLSGSEAVEQNRPSETNHPATFSEKLEQHYLFNIVLAVLPVLYVGGHFADKGFNVNLNVVIMLFLAAALLLHRSPAAFIGATKTAITSTQGIIVQFPLYAGIAGMMTDSGLVNLTAEWFVSVSNTANFPAMTFLSAGLVNIFIPSGGGQWAIQGPVVIEAAKELGANLPQTIMAFAWGDAWTNQIQPFWALPLLGVAGLSARDIMGYCVMWLVLSGVWVIGVFTFLAM
ncbi:short-chain fatty acid transporter [Neisseria montereyensis]|uniref:TIGR00366 family protein n=1 Tax=Neisseria montereyensis TaxID=2973938 RepID=A0ABT2FAH1_9NEIS|nr:TIGR00366 family protein [Neisseria montereyensis]MCS4533199.1 TIGR00366 family protein [Neisseria montereyensis]